MDVARRHHHPASGRLPGDGQHRRCTQCRLPHRRRTDMGHSVPSGSLPLHRRTQAAGKLRGGHLRLPARLESRIVRGCHRTGAAGEARRRQSGARPFGRRGLLRSRHPAAPGHRQEPLLHLRRYGSAPQERIYGRTRLLPSHGAQRQGSTGRGEVSGRPARRHRPRSETQNHRPRLHRGLQRRSESHRKRPMAGTGNHLSGCHRIHVGERPFGDHQVAPQRGRASRRDAPAHRRTAAPPFQGRSEACGTDAGHRPADTRTPPLPRAGTRHPDTRRSDAGTGSRSAGGRQNIHGRTEGVGPVRQGLAGRHDSAPGQERRRDG
ncbi:unknown [Alistipes sp. CAG:157]|nr:unknown [Alistipes sp. CAG:157]